MSLDAVLHPPSLAARRAAESQQVAANTAPPVKEKELTAQEYFERGFDTTDADEKLRFYTQAIRLKPDFAEGFYNRGIVRKAKCDLDGAFQDFNEAIRLRKH